MRITFERLQDLRVPPAIRDFVLSPGFDPSRLSVQVARDFASSAQRLLGFAGPTQVGKSVAAAVGAAECRAPGHEVMVLMPCEVGDPRAIRAANGQDYIETPVQLGGTPLQGRWLHAPECFDHLFDEVFWTVATRCGVLVLDDLGLEPQRVNVRDRLLGLLVGRFDAGRKTILTCNLTVGDFRGMYGQGAGERLMSRLADGGWVQVAAP